MGFKRVLGSGIVGMIIFVPMAYISFTALNLLEQVTGGLIQNIDAITAILPPNMKWVAIIGFGFAGVFLLNMFPVHWALINDPGNIPLLLALVIPWILTAVITAALFAHTPTGGFTSSLAVGIGYFIVMIIIYGIIAALGSRIPIPIDLNSMINDISSGMTGLPFLAAAGTAALEGGAIGGVFGAFIGALKYKGQGAPSSKKSKSKGKSKSKSREPGFSGSSAVSSSSAAADAFCKNCGAKLVPGDDFCTNCGAKA